MQRIGIIAEYNPFHLGHREQIRQVRRLFPGAQIVVAMSGSFVQRGTPAIVNKWQRAVWAARYADLVIELPAVYVLRSAEHFARGDVRLLAALGCTGLACGAENPDLDYLHALAADPDSDRLHAALAAGEPYHLARLRALPQPIDSAAVQANDLLAATYLRALRHHHLAMDFIPLPRYHHGPAGTAANANGSAIRKELAHGRIAPELAADVATDLRRTLADGDLATMAGYEQVALPLLRRMTQAELQAIGEFSEGLENRFYAARHAATLQEFWAQIKSKRYPHSRLRRLTAQYLLGMRRDHLAQADTDGPAWIRPLALGEQGGAILRDAALPVVTRIAAAERELPAATLALLRYDLLATDLAALTHSHPATRAGGTDYYQSPIVIEK